MAWNHSKNHQQVYAEDDVMPLTFTLCTSKNMLNELIDTELRFNVRASNVKALM